jgi:cytoskeleton protein RodZ
MGELPAEMSGKPGSARWAIPLALVAIIVIALAYEFGRPLAEQARSAMEDGKKPAAAPVVPAPAMPAPTSAAPAPVPAPAPVAADSASSPPAPAEAQGGVSSPVPANALAALTGDTPLVLMFRGTSWVEVKDAKGAIVLSTIGYPGATHAVGGQPPFDVVLGNAEAVVVTWHGAAFDVVPFVKQNVAKFTVK